MRRITLTAVCLFIAAFVLPAHEYVGIRDCKRCHKDGIKSKKQMPWSKGPHTHALESLTKKNQDKNPECLQCHVPGYKKPGKKEHASGAGEISTQCDKCHKPGSDKGKLRDMILRKKALAQGNMIPDQETCLMCHNGKCPEVKSKPFDFEKARVELNRQ